MFFLRIRTENLVLNLQESNFHNFKSPWKYNYDCLLVWIWNRRNYLQKFTRFLSYYYILSNPNMTDHLCFS
jgi:hypothetical protein